MACFDVTSMSKSAPLQEQELGVCVFFNVKILICEIKIKDNRDCTSFERYLELYAAISDTSGRMVPQVLLHN